MGRRLADPPGRARAFVPPHCPNPDCPRHLAAPGTYREFVRRGLRRIARAPGWVASFRCAACGRWFRSSAFDDDYWNKIPGLNARLYDLLANGAGLRQAARVLGVAPATVRRRVRRMAARALLVHLAQTAALRGTLDDAVVHDGLRTFAGSRYEPLDLHTAVLAKSGFVLDFNAAPLRRSGTMSPAQRVRRAERDEALGRPDPRARERRSAEILRRLLPLFPEGAPIELRTDEEPAYARAVARVAPGRFRHRLTNSKERRDARNPLWRVNALHAYARHACRPLVRETCAFAKTAAGLLDRAALFVLARNNTKGIAERRRADRRTTPAMLLRLRRAPAGWRALCGRRPFPARAGLPPELRPAYDGTFRARPRENVNPRVPKFVA